MSDNLALNGDAHDNRPIIELFIKVSPVNRDDIGPCPITHQWFMAFVVLTEKRLIHLVVQSVNPDVPPQSYQELNVSRRLPVARVVQGRDPHGSDMSGMIFDTNDEIEQLVDIWKCPNLALPKDSKDEAAAEKAVCDVYKNFSLMLKTDNSGTLVSALRKVDNFLGARQCRYLLSDELTYADCQFMPRLHHVRLAGEYYRGFAIPEDLRHLQDYLREMYACQVFQRSCPADRDVLQLYYDKVPREALSAAGSVKRPPTLMDARRSMLLTSSDGEAATSSNGDEEEAAVAVAE